MARELTLAEQQLVEIARGVSMGARVLILDEPTATLSDAEIGEYSRRWLAASTIVPRSYFSAIDCRNVTEVT